MKAYCLASSPIAPVLGQRIPLRGPARLLYRSYGKAPRGLGSPEKRLTSRFGDKFNIDLSNHLEWQIWAFGSYEEHFADLFRYLVRPADRCIDVGANIGVHTIRLAKLVGARGEVIAIEPDPELAYRANSNLALNGLANVRLVQAAASGKARDTVLLHRPDKKDSNRGRASLLPHAYLTGSATTVPAVTIDDINTGPVSLIKIDVEGHEAAVVSGATKTIDTYAPAIIFEYDPEIIPSKSLSPFDILHTRGYSLFIIEQTRHRLSGRGNLRLERCERLPKIGANILATSPEMARLVSPLVR
jgi:FkbM family methyltransferase